VITKPTVIVLGAGASAPYGFPTGAGLRELLCDKNTEPWLQIDKLISDAIGPGRFEGFVDEFAASHMLSVDAFLEYAEQFRPVGKLAIAGALIPKEDKHNITRVLSHGGRWYAQLLAEMMCRPDDWHNNKLTFVTFNYDRSLEYFLTTGLQHTHGLDWPTAANVMNGTPIIHLHGQLAALDHPMNGGRLYDTALSSGSIRRAADGIQIISEADPTTEAFVRARTAIASAERIMFLGFGFGTENLRRILTPAIAPVVVHGTAFGISSRVQGDAANLLAATFTGGLSIQFGTNAQDIATFLSGPFGL
jgi:hypothetical protein